MRSDYALYGVAIVCFLLAAVFAAGAVQGYTLSEISGIAVTVVFLVIGIIAAAVGYSARPKAMMPMAEPTPPPTQPATMSEPTPVTEEPVEPVTPPPPPPTPVEEVSVTPEPAVPETIESSLPAITASPEVEATQAPVTEAPVEVAPEEKSKPARRRRKKATA